MDERCGSGLLFRFCRNCLRLEIIEVGECPGPEPPVVMVCEADGKTIPIRGDSGDTWFVEEALKMSGYREVKCKPVAESNIEEKG